MDAIEHISEVDLPYVFETAFCKLGDSQHSPQAIHTGYYLFSHPLLQNCSRDVLALIQTAAFLNLTMRKTATGWIGRLTPNKVLICMYEDRFQKTLQSLQYYLDMRPTYSIYLPSPSNTGNWFDLPVATQQQILSQICRPFIAIEADASCTSFNEFIMLHPEVLVSNLD